MRKKRPFCTPPFRDGECLAKVLEAGGGYRPRGAAPTLLFFFGKGHVFQRDLAAQRSYVHVRLGLVHHARQSFEQAPAHCAFVIHRKIEQRRSSVSSTSC